MQMRVSGWRAAVAVGLAAAAQMLSGCGGFFVYPGSTGSGSGSSSSTSTDYVFVSNSASGADYINVYTVTSSGLTSATGSPYYLGYTPQAMVVSYNNAYLFVSNGIYIYGYTIGSGGALSQIGNTALVSDPAVAMAITTDGNWLVTLDNSTALAAPVVNVYGILSGGTLKNSAPVSYASVPAINSGTISIQSADAMQVSPNNNYVAVALGTGGVQVFPFTTSTGVIGSSPASVPGSAATSTTGFFAVAVDLNNDLYIAGRNSSGAEVIESFPVTAGNGVVTVNGQTSSQPVGNSPLWISVNAIGTSTTNADVYVANSTDSTISAFYSTSGTLSQLNSGTAYAAPSKVSALGRDSSGDYLVALGYTTTSGASAASGLVPYTIGSSGGLSAGTGIASTTNNVQAVIAMSH